METDLFIGGKWVPAASRFDVLDPATGDVIASVADGGVEDAAAAVDAAGPAGPAGAATPPPRAAAGAVDAAPAPGPEWAATPPRQRSEVLRRAFELMTERADDLAKLISLE